MLITCDRSAQQIFIQELNYTDYKTILQEVFVINSLHWSDWQGELDVNLFLNVSSKGGFKDAQFLSATNFD